MSREMDVVTLTGEEYDELLHERDDAARYRWLRDRDHWPAAFEPLRGPELDDAIDAAMSWG